MVDLATLSLSDALTPVFEGYLVGLSLVILIGPVLFVLLHAALQSRAGGLAVAFGIFVSDVLIVWACDRWGRSLVSAPEAVSWFSLIGGLVTAGLGVRYWRLPPLDLINTPRLQLRGLTELFWSGFAVNFINPFVFFVWLGIISVASQRHPIDSYRVTFLGSCIAGILTLDLLKVHFAQRLRALLRPEWLRRALRGASVALILLSARLLYHAIAL